MISPELQKYVLQLPSDERRRVCLLLLMSLHELDPATAEKTLGIKLSEDDYSLGQALYLSDQDRYQLVFEMMNSLKSEFSLNIRAGASTLPPSNLEDAGWTFLVSRPHPWRRQLYVKGRQLLASTVWQAIHTQQLSLEQAAIQWQLPIKAIQEIILYCNTHQDLLRLEEEEDLCRRQAQGLSLEVLSLEDLYRLYPNQWVLIEFTELAEDNTPLAGRVLETATTKEDLYQVLSYCDVHNIAIEYTGSYPEVAVVL